MFEKVLIPVDLSDQSGRIVERAAGLKNFREIILLHIIDGNDRHTTFRSLGPAPASPAATAWEKLSQQKELVRDPVITVRLMVLEHTGGSIPEAILKTAETERPSLIVMGARKGLLSGSLLGSGGTAVLSSGRTHILVMRFPERGLLSPAAPEGPALSAQNSVSRSIFQNPQKTHCPTSGGLTAFPS